MTDEVLNPVQIEAAIRKCANRIAEGVKVCSETYAAFLDCDRSYDRAYAQAYLAHDGAAHEKKFAAEIETSEARAVRDAADVAYRYADRTAKAVESELRALQSLGASVRQAYAVAGRGEA
jgi:hypothetical protein